MTLTDLRTALRGLGAASLTQLAAELGSSPREVALLLEFWQRRGDVRTCTAIAGPACGTTCRACPVGAAPRGASCGATATAQAPVVYEWVGA